MNTEKLIESLQRENAMYRGVLRLLNPPVLIARLREPLTGKQYDHFDGTHYYYNFTGDFLPK